MTQAEATTQATALNAILTGAAIADRYYGIIDMFTPNKYSDWNVLLVPKDYETQYNAATLEQKYAFYRVSAAAQAANASNFKTEFDTIGASDEVLQPYLFP